MAQSLNLQFGERKTPFQLQKVDRSRLYGFVATETLDDQGEPCRLVTLGEDGRTLVGPGGIALASFSPQGEWRDKKDLEPVDLDGQPVVPVTSSFKQTIVLDQTVTVDEYLEYSIRSVYRLSSEDSWDSLLDELSKGTIFSFPFSYRGALQADTAFLLAAADGTSFLAVGTRAGLNFVGFEPEDLPSEEDEGEDDMDFGML